MARKKLTTTLSGSVWIDGIQWNEVERNRVKWNKIKRNFIPLFGYFKKEKNKIEDMWWYEMKFISFYFIPLRSILLIFF
jgi:hypothetical protein